MTHDTGRGCPKKGSVVEEYYSPIKRFLEDYAKDKWHIVRVSQINRSGPIFTSDAYDGPEVAPGDAYIAIDPRSEVSEAVVRLESAERFYCIHIKHTDTGPIGTIELSLFIQQ